MAFDITKPIIMIKGSHSLVNINLDLFLDKNNISQIINGGSNSIDTIAEKWAKKNKIDYVAYLAQWGRLGKKAAILRNMDMIDAADICYFFWDKKSSETKQAIEYAQKRNKQYYIHLFENRD